MSFNLTIGRLALLAVLGLGAGGTWYLMLQNGLFEMLMQGTSAALPSFAGRSWTTLKPLDNQLNAMLDFTAGLFEPGNLHARLQTLHFYGLWTSAWLLIQVESYRVGNTWTPISFTVLWGLLAEHVAIAIALPLWCLLHLIVSPTVGQGKAKVAKRTSLLVHPLELAVIPWAVAIGLGVPTAMSAYWPLQDAVPFWKSGTFWVVLRLFHPALTAVAHLVISVLARPGAVQYESAEQRDRNIVRNLQNIYAIATYTSVIPHVAIGTLATLGTLAPHVFSAEYRAAFDPVAMFNPVRFWETPIAAVASVAEGAARFLQWDEIAGSLAIVFWAFFVNRDSVPLHGKGSGLLTSLLKTAAITVGGGPGAAAVALIHERDTIMLDYAAVEQDKKKR